MERSPRKTKRQHVLSTKQECPVPTKKPVKSSSPETDQKNLYHSARKCLSNNYVTSLPGRENEIAQLHKLFQETIDQSRSGSFYISGPPGTGKTACLTHLIQSKHLFPDNTKFLYVNCTSISTIGSIYKKICAELKISATANNEKAYILEIERYLSGKHPKIILVLDEIDQLAGKKQTVLYKIFEWPAISKKSNLIIVGIANSLDLTDRLLSRLQSKCELKPQLMHFPPYSKQQICDILKDRLEKSNSMALFPAATIQLLAAKVAAVSGDIRRALDIARRVIEISESAASKSKTKTSLMNSISKEILEYAVVDEPSVVAPVKMTEVANVLNSVYGNSQRLNNDIENSFPLQQKILICSLLLIIKKDKNKDITVGRLHEVYKKVCKKRTIGAVDYSEFANLCNLAETRGIVRLQKKKEPRLNRICLQWDEEEVTSALQDKQLIADILNDFSSLSK